jgi:hypothetical protein
MLSMPRDIGITRAHLLEVWFVEKMKLVLRASWCSQRN